MSTISRRAFAAGLAAAVPAYGHAAADPLAAWREDVAYFARELPRRHGNAFHTLPRAEFDAMIAALLADLPGLQDHQVPVRLLMITAAIGDGHTYVSMDRSPRYPLVSFLFDPEFRVTQAAEPYREALGTRIAAIGGVEIGEVRRRLGRVISRGENRWFELGRAPGYMTWTHVLQTLGVVPDLGPAPFTFEDDGGRRIVLNLAPAPPQPPPALVEATPPAQLYRQQPADGFWWKALPEAQTVYVCFRRYDELSRKAPELFALVDQQQARRIVVDMRVNGGGDFTLGRRHLITPISQRPQLNRKGGLYVVTGRRTFSAAMSNAADFRKLAGTILVGEPPGERPNSWQENDDFKLPNSKVVVSYSTRFYRFLEGDGDHIPVDREIAPSWADLKAGRDPVLDWVLAQPLA